MAFADLRLAFLPFAQRWNGKSLSANLLILPSGDPTLPLLPGTPPFAGRSLKLRACVVPSLDALPVLGSGTGVALDKLPAPVHALELFTLLNTRFAPQNTVGVPSSGSAFARVRKALPATYTTLLPPGSVPSGNIASLDDFGCTLRGQTPAGIDPGPRTTSWGELISYALRNPYLATALGLRYEFAIDAQKAAGLADGGWLYVTLDPADPYSGPWNGALPDAVKCYAARIPALKPGAARQVFTPVLFPVANPRGTPVTPDEAEIDQAIIEAESYDDGFAKIMHARQPDSLDAHIGDGKTATAAGSDAGIQIGWDDEQVLTWHNRQIALSAAMSGGGPQRLEAPLGVLGYRVDVRLPVAGESAAQRSIGWYSLMQASATVPPGLQGKIPAFAGELLIEPTPSSPKSLQSFWLPLYFAQWRGMPLGTRDDAPHLLAGGVAAGVPGAVNLKPSPLTAQAAPIRLLYGTQYEFRTRLADLTGGGPVTEDNPLAESIAERAAVTFSRWVPPKGLRVAQAFDEGHAAPRADRLLLTRPRIAYPEAVFTWRYGRDAEVAAGTVAALFAQLGMQADGTPGGGPPPANDVVQTGVPDPDVTSVEIVVEVRALAHDRADDVSADGSFVEVYRTIRDVPPLPAIPFQPGVPAKPSDVAADQAIPPLELNYVDVADAAQTAKLYTIDSGPLPIPRSRDVRLRITPLAAGPAGSDAYFGNFPADSARPPVTRGATSHLIVRAPALNESEAPLFLPLTSGRPSLQGLYFQPSNAGDPVAALMRDLAGQLELDVDGMMLRARPGERVIFGTTGFKSVIAADGGSITFASYAEILRHWMVALQWQLNRDWTWDGIDGGTVTVTTAPPPPAPEMPIGQIVVPRIASVEAIEAIPERMRTRIVFLHAIDPTVPDARDGFSNRDPYRLTIKVPAEGATTLAVSSDSLALRLPEATIPAKVPKLQSAGYALSLYQAAVDYSSTAPRQRQLWLELAETPASGDVLFARLLAYAPDPLLYTDRELRATELGPLPALALDPELLRVISPGQPRDSDGSEAIVELIASPTDPLRYLLPLPDGLAADDPRLFGLWTYELRYGHKAPWSLAHARYGRPLQVSGIQHPAPTLPCVAIWQRYDGFIVTDGAAPLIPIHQPTRWRVVVTAPFATPVHEDGRRVGTGIPYTALSFLIYAQVIQVDGSGYRNILLTHQGATAVDPRDTQAGFAYDYGQAIFSQEDIHARLAEEGLPEDAPLSVVAVEFYSPGGTSAFNDPYSRRNLSLDQAYPDHFGVTLPDPLAPGAFAQRRILRTSPLVKVEPYC